MPSDSMLMVFVVACAFALAALVLFQQTKAMAAPVLAMGTSFITPSRAVSAPAPATRARHGNPLVAAADVRAAYVDLSCSSCM